MLLGNLLKSVSKRYRKIPVKGIAFDSRKIKKGDIFFAIRGQQTSGVNFINKAISKGASAIISDKKAKHTWVYLLEIMKQMYLISLWNYTSMQFLFFHLLHILLYQQSLQFLR